MSIVPGHHDVPELPEVERAAVRLRRAAVGRTIAGVLLHHAALSRRVAAEQLASLRGARIERVVRRGKHQLLELEDGRVIHIHFRMAGDWAIGPEGAPEEAHTRATISLSHGVRISLVDPRALSTLIVHDTGESTLPELGPEPADPALTAQTLRASLARRRGPIKPVLLDQRVIAGIGNIYASEALWRARISPRAIASKLSPGRAQRLLEELRRVLGPAASLPGRYREARDSPGIAVYGRAGHPCRRRDGTIRRIVQAGRSTFYCPACQRR